MNCNLSNCKIARKKVFQGFNGIRTRGLCIHAAVLYQLNYEDPYTGGRPIYWVHQPVKGMKHRMKWCELQEYKWNAHVTIAVNRNLSDCKIAQKKVFQGFNGIQTCGLCLCAAVLYQLSWAFVCCFGSESTNRLKLEKISLIFSFKFWNCVVKEIAKNDLWFVLRAKFHAKSSC